jgi:hypothetical protein
MIVTKRNFLTDDELARVWREVDFFNDKLFPPSETGSAQDKETNELLKKNNGVFINRILDAGFSAIYNILGKVTREEFVSEAVKVNPVFNYLPLINSFSYLVNYYDKGDFYKEHHDCFVLSGLLFLFKEPKRFEGGELVFTETGQTITPENNLFVMFPSYMKHEVKPVIMEEEGTGFGRYSIASFLTINN